MEWSSCLAKAHAVLSSFSLLLSIFFFYLACEFRFVVAQRNSLNPIRSMCHLTNATRLSTER